MGLNSRISPLEVLGKHREDKVELNWEYLAQL